MKKGEKKMNINLCDDCLQNKNYDCVFLQMFKNKEYSPKKFVKLGFMKLDRNNNIVECVRYCNKEMEE